MSITYKFEIISTDEQSRCMEIVYSAEGHETMHISARLPYIDEEPEDVIKAYAPISLWEEKLKQFYAPIVGYYGEITPPVPQEYIDPLVDGQSPPDTVDGRSDSVI